MVVMGASSCSRTHSCSARGVRVLLKPLAGCCCRWLRSLCTDEVGISRSLQSRPGCTTTDALCSVGFCFLIPNQLEVWHDWQSSLSGCIFQHPEVAGNCKQPYMIIIIIIVASICTCGWHHHCWHCFSHDGHDGNRLPARVRCAPPVCRRRASTVQL